MNKELSLCTHQHNFHMRLHLSNGTIKTETHRHIRCKLVEARYESCFPRNKTFIIQNIFTTCCRVSTYSRCVIAHEFE